MSFGMKHHNKRDWRVIYITFGSIFSTVIVGGWALICEWMWLRDIVNAIWPDLVLLACV